MISGDERAYILDHAYVPEHLPHYVTAISRTEPFLIKDFVVHSLGSQLVFIGYPLSGKFAEAAMLEALGEAKARFKPETVSIIAPMLLTALSDKVLSPSDAYYLIDISQLFISQKTRNMLTRARREIYVNVGHFTREHKKLIDDFLRSHQVDRGTKFIFQRINEYVKCDTALVFDARNAHGDLIAFDVAEFGARNYGFYMFNFRSRKQKIPGASDLLLAHILERAKREGKQYLNLGLGIDPGIIFFKKKWGATPFLDYVAGTQETTSNEPWEDVFDRFAHL